MYLESFEKCDYKLLIDWIPSEEFNLMWGGPLYSWPITAAQIEEHQSKNEVISFWLVSENEKVGFIELFKVSTTEYRLCRIIISEHAGRGKGYGKHLVQLAIKHAQEELSAETVSLAVFEQNLKAIKCYESIGFKTFARETGVITFNGEDWPLLRMKMVL
ncbi:GNAT family N-acetyltransferase [Photobacterium alginatilyticum]|uniref:GNAT family N-acetyltransferase n=1 Tax=Photobacterium alginatilyticum TaxID=1775171 RepID=A0ABW9YQX5_9GAMM|nr:GNAT family N-acetyltransferase [Photobacterium alginatilyticum]NBI56364.1 GNAT family N-acetyltransferase [Photobacterium alginatilyticum]